MARLDLDLDTRLRQSGPGLGIFDSADLLGGMQDKPHPPGPTSSKQNASGKKAAQNKKAKHLDDNDPAYTTVMLRNIPNKYSRKMLMDQLNDLGFKANARQRFQAKFDGVAASACLPGFNSYKVCQVTRAKWQGRAENVRRLRSSPELMQQLAAHPEWLPLLLNDKGKEEPFPLDDEHFSSGAGRSDAKQQKKKRGPNEKQMPGGFPGFQGGAPMDPQVWAASNLAGPMMANQMFVQGGSSSGSRGGRGKADKGKGNGKGKGGASKGPGAFATGAMMPFANQAMMNARVFPMAANLQQQYMSAAMSFDPYEANNNLMIGFQMMGQDATTYAAQFGAWPYMAPWGMAANMNMMGGHGYEDEEDGESYEEEDGEDGS